MTLLDDEHFPWVAASACCLGFALALAVDPVAVIILAILVGYGFSFVPKGEISQQTLRRQRSRSRGDRTPWSGAVHTAAGSIAATAGAAFGAGVGPGSPQSSGWEEPETPRSMSTMDSVPLLSSTVFIYDQNRAQGRAPANTPASSVLASYPDALGLMQCGESGDFLIDPGGLVVGNTPLVGGMCYRVIRGKPVRPACAKCSKQFPPSLLQMNENGELVCGPCRAAENALQPVMEQEPPRREWLPVRATRFMVGLPFRPVKWLLS